MISRNRQSFNNIPFRMQDRPLLTLRMPSQLWLGLQLLVLWGCMFLPATLMAQKTPVESESPNETTREESRMERLGKIAEESLGNPNQLVRLTKDGRVWIDKKNKRVIADGIVVLRNGQLEMFACPLGTKEHESIVSVLAKAYHIHAGLLAVGATQGKPTQFEPYQPATGSTIRVTVLWKDKEGNKKAAKAQSWIRHAAAAREMNYDWVFAGSSMVKDEETKKDFYLAEHGDLICVANFSTATMDLAVRSDDANTGLVFIANTEKIPELDTPVRLVLQVVNTPPARDDDLQPVPLSEEEMALWSVYLESTDSASPEKPK